MTSAPPATPPAATPATDRHFVSAPSASRFAPPDPARATALLGPYGVWPFHDRRVRPDRRGRPTPIEARFWLAGRRQRGRRRGERDNIYVDRYEVRDVGLAAAVLVLNVLDAFLTVVYLSYGGAEANPVAAWLLECGVGWFLAAKSLAVSVCLLFLILHKNFRFVRPALRLLLFFYAVLLVYHMYLQTSAVIHGLA
jgi:hypothetical protein